MYDVVVLVYPVWWGTAPNAVKTFLQSEDMSGKTMYLVATHGGSKSGNSVADIKAIASADVSDNVLEVYDDDVTDASGMVGEWLQSLEK